MITLYQFTPVWGLPNASPFCMKLETWLRMADISYDNRFLMDPRKSPKGKFPFVKIDGAPFADSELIIDCLKEKFGDVLDKNLSSEQRAHAIFLESAFSERLYWYMVYVRWQDNFGWTYVKEAYFSKLSFITKLFLPNLLRKNMIKTLKMQGTGRHSRAEVLELAYKLLDAIAVTLGDKPYFAGNDITSVDATAFGFLANIVWVPFNCPLKQHLEKHKNILNYCDRMWKTFYPEIKQPFSLSQNP